MAWIVVSNSCSPYGLFRTEAEARVWADWHSRNVYPAAVVKVS